MREMTGTFGRIDTTAPWLIRWDCKANWPVKLPTRYAEYRGASASSDQAHAESGRIRVLFTGESNLPKSGHAAGGLQDCRATLHAGDRARPELRACPRAACIPLRGGFPFL